MSKLVRVTASGSKGVRARGVQTKTHKMPSISFDKASAEGIFVMHIFTEDKFIPVLFRDNKQYVSVRMAEISVLGEFLNLLPPELYNSVRITSHLATAWEIRLLDHINDWHCNNFYGYEEFTQFDSLISLEDLIKFYEYLDFAFSVFHSGGKNVYNDYSNCGFVKVNGGKTLLPYAATDDVLIPSFYFNPIDSLKDKVQLLEGWPLAYLKVCCRIQCVKMEILAKPTLDVVALTDVQMYFPRKATFEEKSWPLSKAKSLFSKKVLDKAAESTLPQVNSDEWTILKIYVS